MTVTQSLIAYSLAAGFLTITPGLDTALVLRTAAMEGPRNAALAGLGIVAGCLVWGFAAALGLGALLAASQRPYIFLLAALHGLMGLAWFAALILATRPIGRFLKRPATVRVLDRLTGLVFVGFGVRLAAARQ